MAEQKPSVRDRLPMVRGLEGVNKADNVLADEAVGAFKKLGDDGAWNLGSNCIVRVSDKKGKKGGKKTTSKDARNECDMLTDYLMALAKYVHTCPSTHALIVTREVTPGHQFVVDRRKLR